ncbi:ras-related protein Rab-9A-like [Hydractinia symbiolongicarpus]|uniref:ras-related protein Rab-9A-like n=1 Tax=Hydractinia symbiolongicarpus TaxID=13093 RepID=UPI002550134D|nr:ras-related protein Rab-9A-like [Hydractinia symbiolongicarpus]
MAKPNFLKVIILGDGAVGKSALMNRFVNNKFDSQSFHTIGVEFLNKEVKVNGEMYTLQIWDTAGQERFKSLRTPFYRGSDICLLVYSVDDEQSFYNLDTWKREFLYYADVKDADLFPFVVLGNKIDLPNHEVPPEQVSAWCHDNGKMQCFETSAKDSINVEQAFVASVERWLQQEQTFDKQMKPGANYNNQINLKKQGDQRKSNDDKLCC